MVVVTRNEIATTLNTTDKTISDVFCRTVGMLSKITFVALTPPFSTMSDVVSRQTRTTYISTTMANG